MGELFGRSQAVGGWKMFAIRIKFKVIDAEKQVGRYGLKNVPGGAILSIYTGLKFFKVKTDGGKVHRHIQEKVIHT